jgi:hypothetical protein
MTKDSQLQETGLDSLGSTVQKNQACNACHRQCRGIFLWHHDGGCAGTVSAKCSAPRQQSDCSCAVIAEMHPPRRLFHGREPPVCVCTLACCLAAEAVARRACSRPLLGVACQQQLHAQGACTRLSACCQGAARSLQQYAPALDRCPCSRLAFFRDQAAISLKHSLSNVCVAP